MGSRTKLNNNEGLASPKRVREGGYTLIEMLVVFSALALLVTLSEMALHTYVSQIGLSDTSTSYVQMLRRAQSLATSGRGDSAWGVNIASSSITLFKGLTYATRDQNYDEQYQAGMTYTLSGVTEVDFAKLTGIPSLVGTTTLSIGSSTPKAIYINAKGTIMY